MTDEKKKSENEVPDEELEKVSGGLSIEQLASNTLNEAYGDSNSDLEAVADEIQSAQDAKSALRDAVNDLRSVKNTG